MKANSKRKRRSSKPAIDRPPKPYDGFPLGAANCGSWAKKIRGKIHYFGKWGHVVKGKLERIDEEGNWRPALEKFEQQRDALFAGRTPRVPGEGLTLRELCNRFLNAKKFNLESGELSPRTFAEYHRTTDRLIELFGKDRLVDDLAADDFERLRANVAKVWGPVRLGNEIQRVRTVFKYALEAGLTDKPMRFGSEFRKPSNSVLRKHRATNGERMFTADEIRALLDIASPQVKAMILLGINCGFGNHDVSCLPRSAADLKNKWIDFPRPKTGINRRCPLWPETVSALEAVIAKRPIAKEPADRNLVFITKYGHRWMRSPQGTPINGVGQEFGKLLSTLKIKRPGLGFYALRHTFRTIADATKDFPAIRLIMGHVDSSIDNTYREAIDDARLVAVAEHVRTWLFG
jgi:integrase